MRLRAYLRQEFSDYIRPKLIKDYCEVCGKDSELHLHHVDRFLILLLETLNELNLKEMDVEYYTEAELNAISNFMLAKQIKGNYKTLCKTCHYKAHYYDKINGVYEDIFYNPYGKFFFVNTKAMLDIDNTYLTKLLFLCCYTDYDNIIRWGRGKSNMANKKDIKEMLALDNVQFYKFYNYAVDNGYLIETDNFIIISKDFCYRGVDNSFGFKAKIFNDNFINLYTTLKTRAHKKLGNIIKLIDICDKYNDPNMTMTNIGRKLNIAKDFRSYLKGRGEQTDLSNLLIEIKPKKLILNPSIIYQGDLTYDNKDFLDNFI